MAKISNEVIDAETIRLIRNVLTHPWFKEAQ